MPQRYEVRHQGPAIVCGGAPSVFVDVEKAVALRPGATLLGANFAAGLFPGIEHVWTQHNNQAQLLRDGLGSGVKIHGRAGIMGDIDYEWPELHGFKGSSGLVGAFWAKAMGFDEVIMAGIPLSTSETKYSEKYPGASRTKDFATEASILGWQRVARQHKENGRTQGIYSMSGYTKKLFGPVPGLED